jgi:hypothetical protein
MKALHEFWGSLSRGTRFQVLFYAAAFVVGVLLFFGPAVFPSKLWEPVTTGLGIALVAASLLGFAHRLFFFDDFETEMEILVARSLKSYLEQNMFPFMHEGVERLYLDRSGAIREFSQHIKLENERIVIIGSSLKGLLDPTERDKEKKDFADLLRKKIKAKIAVEFLLTHPALAFLREDAERRKPGDIKKEILETLKYLLDSLRVPVENIWLYHGTPTIFSLITSERMLVNPYTYQANAYENFCFEISKKSEQGLYARLLTAHFRKPIDNRDTTTPLTDAEMKRIPTLSLADLFPSRMSDLIGKEFDPVARPRVQEMIVR